MSSSREYLDFILEQFSPADGVAYRPMMGEFVLYCDGKVIGGIYDDRLLVKPTASALVVMPGGRREIPYDGGKEMLLVEEIEDAVFLKRLFHAIAADLPAPKKR